MINLWNAYFAEQQAIAIYRAEVFWRRGTSGNIFREILAEEEGHCLLMEPFLGNTWLKRVAKPLNVAVGWAIGCLLSILPRRLCYRAHVWAEVQAAKTYRETLEGFTLDVPPALRKAMILAEQQELGHAKKFSDLLGVK